MRCGSRCRRSRSSSTDRRRSCVSWPKPRSEPTRPESSNSSPHAPTAAPRPPTMCAHPATPSLARCRSTCSASRTAGGRDHHVRAPPVRGVWPGTAVVRSTWRPAQVTRYTSYATPEGCRPPTPTNTPLLSQSSCGERGLDLGGGAERVLGRARRPRRGRDGPAPRADRGAPRGTERRADHRRRSGACSGCRPGPSRPRAPSANRRSRRVPGRPPSSGPVKLPPVSGTIRRRPWVVSPSSSGTASVASSR